MHGLFKKIQGLKPIKFVYSGTYLQQKKIQELKPKIREYTGMKMIFKFINYSVKFKDGLNINN
jgi:hypothetical protein